MTLTDYSRAYAATMQRESKPNYNRSFKNLQQNAIVIRKTWIKIMELYEYDCVQILKEYSTSKGSTMLAERQAKLAEARRQIESELKGELDAVIQSKRDAIQKACRAPSTDDTNLLAVLNMRAKLSENDIIHAAESVGNNLLALGTIADIAERHQIYLPIPTAEKYEEKLDKAINYARSRLAEVFVPEKELSYFGTEFFNFPDLKDCTTSETFSELDDSVFTSEQVKDGHYISEHLRAAKEALKEREKEKKAEKAKNDTQ